MKPIQELMRLMLLRTEAIGIDNEAAERYHSECEKYDVLTRTYQALLMKEDGLIEAIISKDERGNPSKAAILRMTTKGHEYLDKIRTAPLCDGTERASLT